MARKERRVGGEVHEWLGAVGHEDRLNSCAPNTSCREHSGNRISASLQLVTSKASAV